MQGRAGMSHGRMTVGRRNPQKSRENLSQLLAEMIEVPVEHTTKPSPESHRDVTGDSRALARREEEASATGGQLATHRIGSNRVSGVDSPISGENAGKSTEYADPGAGR